jgi:type IV secretory pathway ATPase VirB11/archaellum biosynthesis ATPase
MPIKSSICAASDAHDSKHRTPALDAAWEHVEKEFGARAVRNLLEKNPAAALTGNDGERVSVNGRKKFPTGGGAKRRMVFGCRNVTVWISFFGTKVH